MPPPQALTASKVVAVHVNYRSRARQRGYLPAEPSYFLKPPSSLTGDGRVVRPRGTELLVFEGEVAVVIGERAQRVTPAEAWSHIGWYAPANDFGLWDLRWADRGSNVLSKGHDGFTPIGPLAAAAEVDPRALRLTTRVNGEVAQDDVTSELIFDFGTLVADISRFVTLEAGDVLLTGTPAGSRPVAPGDVVEVELAGVGSVRSEVVEGDHEIAPYGAQPKVSPATRAAAFGLNGARPVAVTDAAVAALRSVSTATLTVALAKRGISRSFLAGLRPLRDDARMVGYARTLRYGALREDVRDYLRGSQDAQKRAVESISPDDVLIIEARGESRAGTIGDILAARVLARGGAGIVTDGAVRDTPGLAGTPIPTYCRAAHAASLWTEHVPLEGDVPITCAGVLVMPGDVLVGDGEGVVVLPAELAEEVAHESLEQERREAWAMERVRAGESIRGVYPLSPEREAEYASWRAQRGHDQ